MGEKVWVENCLIVKEEEKPDVADSLLTLKDFAGTIDDALAFHTNDGNCVSSSFSESNNSGGEEDSEIFSPFNDTTKADTRRRPPTLLAFHQQRYDHFLQAYFGFEADQRAKCIRQAAQMCVIGLGFQKRGQTRNADVVYASRRLLRHSVLAVEGDAAFFKLVQRARPRWCDVGDNNSSVDDPRHWPNARCIALHYGLPPLTTDNGQPFLVGKDYQGGQKPKFLPATLMAVVASTIIEDGETVRLCLRSYHRCLDEATWYEQLFGVRHNEGEAAVMSSVTRGRRRFHMWPDGLAFYHGVGSRHAGAEPVAGFPFTLLELAEAKVIGEGEKGLFAAHPVPYGTCFLYCGPSVATKVLEAREESFVMKRCVSALASSSVTNTSSQFSTSNANNNHNIIDSGGSSGNNNNNNLPDDIPLHDATYALGLGRHGVCFGQGLMRYANHRYNISKFGNVELCSVMLSVTSEFSSLAAGLERRRKGAARTRKKKKGGVPKRKLKKLLDLTGVTKGGHEVVSVRKRRYRPLSGRRIFLEEHSHFVTIPFFITTTDIEVGQQLLAWSYGEEYDARLERQVVCDGSLVPYADAAVLDARTPVGRWQPYKGDYRHGIGVGDIVWYRQPLPGGYRDPVDELFVVLEMLPNGMDYLLLRPFTRNGDAKLQELLGPYQNSNDEMLLLGVCESKVLDWCIIAHVNYLALLLGDIDYWSVWKAKRTLTSSRPVHNECCCGGGSSCLIHLIVVNNTALRAATKLVLESRRSVTGTERTLNGRVWPFLQMHSTVKGRSSRKKKDIQRNIKSGTGHEECE